MLSRARSTVKVYRAAHLEAPTPVLVMLLARGAPALWAPHAPTWAINFLTALRAAANTNSLVPTALAWPT